MYHLLIYFHKYRNPGKPWGQIHAEKEYTSIEDVEQMLEKTDVLADFEERKKLAKVHVNVPKFRIESDHDKLKDVLEALGMTEMFKEGKADFTGMADWAKRESLHVTEVTFFLSDSACPASLL